MLRLSSNSSVHKGYELHPTQRLTRVLDTHLLPQVRSGTMISVLIFIGLVLLVWVVPISAGVIADDEIVAWITLIGELLLAAIVMFLWHLAHS